MKEFYEYLQSLGIVDPPDTMEVIQKLPIQKVIEVSVRCYELTETSTNKCLESTKISAGKIIDSSIFNFSAGSSISGGIHPCSCVDCRIENVHKLATFVALYADKVIIPNPFEHIYYNLSSNFNFKNNDQWNFFVNRLIGDIVVMLNLKPLINKDLLIINPQLRTYCEEHLKQQQALEKKLHNAFKKINGKVINDLNKNIQFILDTDKSVLLKGGKNYVSQEVIKFALLPKQLQPYTKLIPYIFKPTEVEKLGLAQSIINPIVDDLILQKYLTLNFNVSYLTNREVETNIINYLGKKTSEESKEKAIFDGLAHQLPFIENASLDTLIKVRKQELEAFTVYRDSVRKTICEARNETNIKMVQKMVKEIINPQLNKLNQVMKSHRDNLLVEGGKDIIFSSIFFTAGLFINPEPLLTTSTLFGIGLKYASGSLRNFLGIKKIPEEAKNSNYYFLWKLEKTKH